MREKKKIKFLEFAGVSDALDYQQAYETIITGISEDVSEIYCCFYNLNVLNGTIIKVVATKKRTMRKFKKLI